MERKKTFDFFKVALYEKCKKEGCYTGNINSAKNWSEIFIDLKKNITPYLEWNILEFDFLLDYVPESILLENGFILDKEIDVFQFESVFLLMNSKIGSLIQYSTVIYMIDSEIQIVANSDIHTMRGNSSIQSLNGNSTVKWMSENSHIEVMNGESIVFFMQDSASIRTMKDSSEVKTLCKGAFVADINDNAKIRTLDKERERISDYASRNRP